MVRTIDIHKLNLDELLGVVSIYPWYAGARKELCDRMAAAGSLAEGQISEAAIYMGSRRLLSELMRRERAQVWSDSEAAALLSRLVGASQDGMQPEESRTGMAPASASAQPEGYSGRNGEDSTAARMQRIIMVGGDYFSTAQYRQARREEDNIFSAFATSDREVEPEFGTEDEFDPCTETLARIYAEQGYPDEAKQIYSKLSLRYPEKSVYFAALIEELNKN